jgi:hypothetical protein
VFFEEKKRFLSIPFGFIRFLESDSRKRPTARFWNGLEAGMRGFLSPRLHLLLHEICSFTEGSHELFAMAFVDAVEAPMSVIRKFSPLLALIQNGVSCICTSDEGTFWFSELGGYGVDLSLVSKIQRRSRRSFTESLLGVGFQSKVRPMTPYGRGYLR